MIGETTKVRYTGSTPGADANDYPLFSTVTAFPGASWCAQNGIERLLLQLIASGNGTLKWYSSTDRGTNWTLRSTQAVTGGSSEQAFDFSTLPAFSDWKLIWTNGGAAQTTFLVNMVLDTQRAALT